MTMDSHHRDENGSESEGGGVMSNRQRRKQQLQHKQQNQSDADVVSTATPADTNTAGNPPEADTPVGSADDGWAHNQQPPMTGPCKVEYCPSESDPNLVCSLL